MNKHSQQNCTRLALDIGTNSIGWALYNIDKNKKPYSIIGAGVRIFSSGRTPKEYTTLNATRRQARLVRRQRDRYLQRRTYLIILLEKHGLFPKDKFSAKNLANLNPYELRAKGLDKKLDIHHFGRALFHLNQRRGFKSNRRSSDEKEDGLIARSVKASKEEMQKHNARTYGEFLYKRFQKMKVSRKTPGSQQENWVLARKAIGAGAKDNYAVYAQRAMLEEEFNKLWDSQARFHEFLKDQKIKSDLFKVIFYQRCLKQPIVGTCELTSEKRIHKALPSFQKFRILKELNNLAYINNHQEYCLINSIENGIKFRDKIIKDLFQKKSQVRFSVLEKAFKNFFPEIEDFSSFNLDTYNRDYLEGNKTSVVLRKTLPNWDNWALGIQDRFIELLEGENEENHFMKTDEKVLDDLKKFNKEQKLNLSEEQLKECVNKLLNKLPKDHGRYSKTAIYNILPFLEEGKQEFETLPLAGYGHHSDRRYKGELLKELPLYQEVLSSHSVEMRSVKKSDTNKLQSKKEKYKNFRIPNPTVHIAFNQLRLVVNDIIRVYGKPAQVVIETARDLPMGQKSKKELEKQQKANKEKNESAKQIIQEFNAINNRANRFRYRLWEEQSKKCIYSGKPIPKSKLYTAELEIDHILPWSQTLDDGLSNKVLVYKSANQNKGNKTPFEFFSSHKEQWQEIGQRVKELPKNKRWRFNKNAMDKFKEEGGWLERQLNDTRYISRYAKQYLERICKEVWTVRGQTTAIFRWLLQEHEKKNRDDHRNHANDALIIGLIDRSLVQHISNIAKQKEKTNKAELENIGKAIKKEVTPWSSFKKDVKLIIDKVIVSHRRRTKKEGRLHNETAYGFTSETSDFSKPIDTFHYVDILSDGFVKANKKKIEKIVSEKIKQDFLEEFQNNHSLSKEFLIAYHQKIGIRRVRLKEKKTVIPIKNKSGKIYKAFNGDSNYAVWLFINSSGKWSAEVIDTFTANQKNFTPIPEKSRLMKGDMLYFDNKFWRLVKFNQHKQLIFAEHFEANVDARNRSTENEYKYTRLQPASLQKHNPKRVDISPCGKVKLTPFDLYFKKKDSSSEKSA